MNTRTYIPLACAIALVFITAAVVAVWTPRAASEVRPLPDVTLTTFDGQAVSLREEVRGQVAIINAWASWCPYCTRELPDFVHIQEEFGDSVVVLAINRKESRGAARAYLEQHAIDEGAVRILFDDNDAFYAAIQGVAMPETVVVDRTGDIVFHARGPMTLADMRRVLAETLADDQ